MSYILSVAGGGHGDDIWAASRRVANLLASPETCRELLKMDQSSSQESHPLLGLHFVELGAGAGVPSWVALKRGAHVVCTDQAIPGRIRTIAECAERNRGDSEGRVWVGPYDWGSPVGEMMERSAGGGFEVVLASDCLYNPELHGVLLDSIEMLMAPEGVGLLPFALHGNTADENVWGIVGLAESKGFTVEVLESAQLTPQCSNMRTERALVNMIRLSRPTGLRSTT